MKINVKPQAKPLHVALAINRGLMHRLKLQIKDKSVVPPLTLQQPSGPQILKHLQNPFRLVHLLIIPKRNHFQYKSLISSQIYGLNN